MHLRSGGTDKLLAMMDAAGVARSVLVNVPETHGAAPGASFCDSYAAGQLGDDREALAQARNQHPDRLALMLGGAELGPMIQCTPPAEVGSLDDPESVISTFRARALALAETPGFAGFGEMISLHLCMDPSHSYQVALADHPLFLELGRIAVELDVPIDLHMEAVPEGGLSDPGLIDSLQSRCTANPDTLPATIEPLLTLLIETRATVVWQHIGWDNTGQLTPDLLRTVLDECFAEAGSTCGLYFALRVPPGGGPNRLVAYEAGTPTGPLAPDWAAFIEDFPDRIMLGADEFVGNDDLPAAFTNT